MSRSSRPRVVLVNRCFVKGDDGKLLVIRRSANDTNSPEKWEVPGGKLEVGQDLSHAQEREVMEETGLLVVPIYRLACVDSRVLGEGKYIGLPYVVMFSVTRAVGGKLKLSDEHDDHRWVNYEELLEFDLTFDTRKAAITLKDLLVSQTVPT